jgi:hypothetical protein
MGEACGMYRDWRYIQGFGGETWWKYTAYLEDVSVDGSVEYNLIFKKWDGEGWTGLLSLRRGTDGGRLWMR